MQSPVALTSATVRFVGGPLSGKELPAPTRDVGKRVKLRGPDGQQVEYDLGMKPEAEPYVRLALYVYPDDERDALVDYLTRNHGPATQPAAT